MWIIIIADQFQNFTMHEGISVSPGAFVLDYCEPDRKHMCIAFEDIGFNYQVESANDPVNFARICIPKSFSSGKDNYAEKLD